MAKLTDARKYEVLFDAKNGEMRPEDVGGIRTRTIRAGKALEVEVYPLIRGTMDVRRETKRRRSSAAQAEVNLRNARKRVRRLLEENFDEGDFHATLTFDYGFIERGFDDPNAVRREWEELGYPQDDAEALRFVRNYIRRARDRYARLGFDRREFKYLYVIESSKEPQDGDFNALPPRYHFHIVTRCPGMGREELEALWPHGHVNADHLRVRDGGLAALAKYITKQRRCTRRWAGSRNLREPEVRVSDRKISRRRAALVARDVQAFGREIFEKIYPDYRLEETPVVRFSDFVPGAYIYARMRRR